MKHMYSNLHRQEIIILQLIIQKIDDENIKQYLFSLISDSIVIAREYSEYGAYINFQLTNKNRYTTPPIDMPISFSIDLNKHDIKSYIFCILYLTEDRKEINFLEISTIYDNFYDLWNSMGYLSPTFTK